MTLTQRQQDRINFFRSNLIARRVGEAHAAKYEFKRFEVEERDGLCFLKIEIGRIGDEGTMASVLARDYRLIMIGKRGGLDLLNAQYKSKSEGIYNAMYALVE